MRVWYYTCSQLAGVLVEPAVMRQMTVVVGVVKISVCRGPSQLLICRGCQTPATFGGNRIWEIGWRGGQDHGATTEGKQWDVYPPPPRQSLWDMAMDAGRPRRDHEHLAGIPTCRATAERPRNIAPKWVDEAPLDITYVTVKRGTSVRAISTPTTPFCEL